MQGVQVQSLAGELRFHIPCSQNTKRENRSNVVSNSINPLRMVYIKKKKILKKKTKFPFLEKTRQVARCPNISAELRGVAWVSLSL